MRFAIALAACAAISVAACTPPAAELTGQALVERGDYLVNGVVLCGDCHTPRVGDAPEGGPPDLARRLQGAPVAVPPPLANYAPALAGGPVNYSEAQFISFLQDGVRPDGSQPRPPMPPYRLNEEDARAVSAYIRSLPPAADAVAPAQ